MATGRRFTEADKNKVCAVSRDWLHQHRLRIGSIIMIKGYTTCTVEDTMAKYVYRHHGQLQKRRIDIFNGKDIRSAYKFGVKYRRVYLVIDR